MSQNSTPLHQPHQSHMIQTKFAQAKLTANINEMIMLNANSTSINQIINSHSMSSSLSSSSTSSSNSTTSNPSTQGPSGVSGGGGSSSHSKTTTHTSNGLTAPLATISELANYTSNTPKNVCNSLTAAQSAENNGNKSNGSPGDNNKIYDMNLNMCNLVNNKYTNSYLIKNSKPKKVSDSSNSKYFSATALSSSEANNGPASNGKKLHTVISTGKKSSANNSPTNHFGQGSAAASSNANNNSSVNKSLRNFFGKLMRTSLVNINDATSGSYSSSKNNGKYDSTDLMKTSLNVTSHLSTAAAAALDLSPPMTRQNQSAFKRGGFRSTADARLQSQYNTNLGYKSKSVSNHHSYNRDTSSNSSVANTIPAFILDTLSFAKWSTHQVCEWLNKNGFGLYFPQSADGSFCHKWIKNGLQLLQATQYEYEKVKQTTHVLI
jgi:hypothetical protein